MNTDLNKRQDPSINTRTLFCGLWLLMFALYFPAARAGFVADFTGWLDQIKNHSFSEYINRSNFDVVSLYQVTQFITWVFYQLFGANAWLWHLLFLTLHVTNACLLALICGNMLRDAAVPDHKPAVYIGAVFFCVTPYISEVIVWEPSFHYLQGLLFILLIIFWIQRYIAAPRRSYILLANAVYLVSTHTLEVFYITPWLVLVMAMLYRTLSVSAKGTFMRVVLFFFLPMLLIFVLRLAEYRLLYGDWVSRIGSNTVFSAQETGLGKPAKYLFHLLFLGRYLPDHWHAFGLTMHELKTSIYAFLDSSVGIILFYTGCFAVFAWGLFRFRHLSGRARVSFVLLAWTFIALVLIIPLWFGTSMLIAFDRYSYFACAFLFMLMGTGLAGISNRYLKAAILLILVLANLRYAIQTNRYWGKSEKLVRNLLHQVPMQEGKTMLLLNVPECMHGASMIGAWPYGEFKLMHNLLVPGTPLSVPEYEVLSYNMLTPNDGVHVVVIDDSTLKVVLNQWGTWWWYKGKGGQSYENNEYRLELTDPGHEYILHLKNPANQYNILFQTGSQWRVVDMVRKNEEQH